MLQIEPAKSQAELKGIVVVAEAKMKDLTEDLRAERLQRSFEVENLNEELASAKAQLLEEANRHHEKSNEYRIAINMLELEKEKIPGVELKVTRLREEVAESSRRAKVKASKLNFENVFAMVKTRLKALKECKDAAIELDVEIAKAETNVAEAQKSIDDLPSSKGSDEDEYDD